VEPAGHDYPCLFLLLFASLIACQLRRMSNARLAAVPGMKFRPVLTASVPDTCRSLIELSIVPKK
jgi:hypothetical protein